MSEFKFCKDCRYFAMPPFLVLEHQMEKNYALSNQSHCMHPKLGRIEPRALVIGHIPARVHYKCMTNREDAGPGGCGVDAKLFEPKPTDADHGDAHPETSNDLK